LTPWAEREARRIQKAVTLLQPGIPGPGGLWADVGCGDGIFTSALHSLIRPGDEIYAVDRDQYVLDALACNFAESYPDAVLHPVRADFGRGLMLPPLDGLVMANSLHFARTCAGTDVTDKASVLARLTSLLKPGRRLIVVEYNTNRGNAAVPYPLDEAGFIKLATDVGLRDAQIMARIPSSFLGEMYAGVGSRE
jgi:ubiquinone/menaquinone biosynthesis C-methylase UbiE